MKRTPVKKHPVSSSATASPSKKGSGESGNGNNNGGNNLKVYVRLRDYNESERQKMAPNDLAVRMKEATCEVTVPGRGKFPFTFDDCFWSNSLVEEEEKPYFSQEDMFTTVGLPLVENALQGFNSAIIAYGQTGSGKTYSIFGPQNCFDDAEKGGLIPRVCNEIFDRLRPYGALCSIHVSMIEVYLEEVFDLLNSRKKLVVRQDSATSFGVVGNRQSVVHSFKDVIKLLDKADGLKTFACTALNDRSSRAHTLFQLELRMNTDGAQKTARVLLADLAGCERIKVAKTDHGTALDEACNINLSLLTLGTCIEAAVQRSKLGKTIENMGEFRQSTLTKLLKDYIGGNSRTAMLVTIGPSIRDVHLTLQALRFADRAKQIQNHAKINYVVARGKEAAAAARETIQGLYDRKKELLEKECEIELAYQGIKSKQEEMREMAERLAEEKRAIEERRQTVIISEEEKRILAARLKEIEDHLRGLSKELADSEKGREELEAKLLEVCGDNAVIISDKEALERKVHELTVELESARSAQADELLAQQMEAEALRNQLAGAERRLADSEHQRQALLRKGAEDERNYEIRLKGLEVASSSISRERDGNLKRAMRVETLLAEAEIKIAAMEAEIESRGLEAARLRGEFSELSSAGGEAARRAAEREASLAGQIKDLQAEAESHRAAMTAAMINNEAAVASEAQRYLRLNSAHHQSVIAYEHLILLIQRSKEMIFTTLVAKEDALYEALEQSSRARSERLWQQRREDEHRAALASEELAQSLRRAKEALQAAELSLVGERSRREHTEGQLRQACADAESGREAFKTLQRELEAEKESHATELNELRLNHSRVINQLSREKEEALFRTEAAAKRDKLNDLIRAERLAQQCKAVTKIMDSALSDLQPLIEENSFPPTSRYSTHNTYKENLSASTGGEKSPSKDRGAAIPLNSSLNNRRSKHVDALSEVPMSMMNY